jgi:hypothetical protein
MNREPVNGTERTLPLRSVRKNRCLVFSTGPEGCLTLGGDNSSGVSEPQKTDLHLLQQRITAYSNWTSKANSREDGLRMCPILDFRRTGSTQLDHAAPRTRREIDPAKAQERPLCFQMTILISLRKEAQWKILRVFSLPWLSPFLGKNI